MSRVPIIRRDADGTIIDGTAEVIEIDHGETIGYSLTDFRDLDGTELCLPVQSSFEAVMDLPVPEGYTGIMNVEITKMEVYTQSQGAWMMLAMLLCLGIIIVLFYLWAN